MSAAQWQKIYDDVISVLATQDADLVCEVHISRDNESGILDTTVESSIRERLRQQNIPVEIRKEACPAKARALAAAGRPIKWRWRKYTCLGIHTRRTMPE